MKTTPCNSTDPQPEQPAEAHPIPSSFEQRRQRRIERLKDAADNARERSQAAFQKADRMASVIPFGQPILVGHHSEKADRNYRGRIHSAMGKGCEEASKAAYFERRADAAESNPAIFSDDPDAPDKLAAKIAEAERFQAVMKECNAAIRKHAKAGASAQVAALAAILRAAGMVKPSPEDKARELLRPDFCQRIGFPGYALQNNSANIRRMKERFGQAQARATAQSTEKEIGEIRVGCNVEENRVQLFFPGKPDEKTRTELKRYGFRWCPTAGAWQRHLTDSASQLAEHIAGGFSARFEAGSDTIRSIPENYCLAHRINGAWQVYTDEKATDGKHAAIAKALEGYHPSETYLAARIGAVWGLK